MEGAGQAEDRGRAEAGVLGPPLEGPCCLEAQGTAPCSTGEETGSELGNGRVWIGSSLGWKEAVSTPGEAGSAGTWLESVCGETETGRRERPED